MQNDRILRLPEVQMRIGRPARATLYRWIQRGEFPRPLRLGGGSVGWRESAVNEWIDSRPLAEQTQK